jgi:threonyl-tRNA synthetase
MVHKALLGSFERFLSVYLEHTDGKFPIWLAPEQVRLITLNQEEPVVRAAEEIQRKGRELGLRVELDNSNESVGKKIREAEVMKVPYAVVVGNKEIESQHVTPRVRSDLPALEQETLAIDDFLQEVADDAKARK